MQYIIYMEKNEEILATTDSAIQKKKGSKEIQCDNYKGRKNKEAQILLSQYWNSWESENYREGSIQKKVTFCAFII